MKRKRVNVLPAEGRRVHGNDLLTGGGDLVGGHAGVVQGQVGQGAEIGRVHLVQLGKRGGNAHAAAELLDKLDDRFRRMGTNR